jgi:hypothetical protein
MKRTLFAALFLLAAPSTARAQDTRHVHTDRDRDPLGWYVPDYARLQTGGYTGLMTVGLGYGVLNDVINIGADYGFTPAAHAGRNVHSVSANLSIRPLDFRVGDVRFVPLYFGGGGLFTWGDGYFLNEPSRYDQYAKNYYWPTAAHWTAHVGVEVDWLPPANSVFERHGFFWEVRTIDTYFFSAIRDPGTVRATEAVSSALGYRVAF